MRFDSILYRFVIDMVITPEVKKKHTVGNTYKSTYKDIVGLYDDFIRHCLMFIRLKFKVKVHVRNVFS